ncbi:unnamed protein product [Diamesa hyperborea]
MKFKFIIYIWLHNCDVINCNGYLFKQKTSDSYTNPDVTQTVIAITKYLNLVYNRTTLNILTATEDLKDVSANDYATDILLELRGLKLLFRLEHYKKFQDIKKRKRFVNLILADSIASYYDLIRASSANDFDFDGFNIVHVENGTLEDVKKILKIMWNASIYNIIVLFEEKDVVSLMSFTPFTSSECRVSTPVIVNQMKDGKFLNSDVFFRKKFKNLFNCGVKIAASESTPSLMGTKHSDGSYSLRGYDYELISLLSKLMNFKIDLNFTSRTGSWGEIFENGSSTGTIKKLMDGESDFIVGNLFLMTTRMKYMSNTLSYLSISVVLIIPPGQLFTSFEKLFKPFQTTVWIYVIVLTVIGFIVIFITKCQNKRVQHFVFGKGVSYQHLNMLLIFVGGSQHSLPRYNFSRFILMTFILFCLVGRTLYQGSLYNFIQTDKQSAEIATIDELVEQGFDFYMYNTYQEFVRSSRIYKRRKIYTSDRGAEFYLKNMLDPSLKLALIATTPFVSHVNQHNDRNSTLTICKQQLLTIPIVLYFRKNHYLVKEVNEKISMINSAGLSEYWSKMNSGTLRNAQKSKRELRKLNLHQLLGGFQIWIGGCIIGLVTFVVECILFRVKH